MTDRDEPPAGEPAAPASTGRHGGNTGLSAAELIARSRAASPDLAQRPSRSARRAALEAEVPPNGAAGNDVEPPDPAAPARHLHVVEALRSAGADKPAREGLAFANSRHTGSALATPVLDPPAGHPDSSAPGPAAPRSTAPGSTAPGTAAPASTAPGTALTLNGESATDALPGTPKAAPTAPGPGITAPESTIPPVAAPPRKSRAGRNLPAAMGVGVGLAVLVIGTLAVYRPSFVVLLSIAVAIGVYEMVTAVGTVAVRPPLVPLLAGVLVMETAAWFRGPDGLVGALLLTVLGLTVWRLADGATGYLRDVAAGNLVALYIPFLAGFATLMAHADDGAARIVLFVLTVVCSDTGGYAVGVLIGKHPMAPTVSPKKSWEGFAGSLLAGGIAGVLMMVFCFHQQWWQGAVFGVAVVATATLGDLGESMIKRDLGIKDMGTLLPGHGGVMDRLDSLLPCAPVAYLLLAAFLPG
jgi:phosphatidate cytidylyltransferase